MTPTGTTKRARAEMLNKVPEATIFFWIIKITATTVGETAADFLNDNLGLGPGPTPEVYTRLARSLQRWVATAREAGLDAAAIESLVRGSLQQGTTEGVA